jgi:APA family basic amino acid/polyamine antiporter
MSPERPRPGRVGKELRRRGGEAEARIARGLGEPALFAISLSGVGATIYLVLGIVAGDALGLTPAVFALSALFFIVTMLTYVEASSLHLERGGASMFARYAFDELWSFIAGWAILLDYVIVMAIGGIAVSHYLAAFWGGIDDTGIEVAIAGLAIAWVAWSNYRGLTAERYRNVLRLSLVSIVLFVALMVVGYVQLFDLSLITDSVDPGDSPEWADVLFSVVIASVALTGIEAASGLAGDLRVGRRGLKRVTVAAAAVALVVFVGVSGVALMAVPVENGATDLGGNLIEAPLLGVVDEFDPAWLAEVFRYAVGTVGALVVIGAMNAQMLGIGRLSYSLGTHRQIPSVLSRLDRRYSTPYVTIAIAAVLAFALVIPADIEFLAGIFAFGAMIAFTLAHLSVIVLRFREPERKRAFRIPLSIPVGRGSIPLPAAFGALLGSGAWVSVVVLHEGARYFGGAWIAFGLLLYVIYRRQQGKPLRKRFEIPAEALRERDEAEYGSILVPVYGEELDDDIVGTAGRLAAEEADEGEGGAVLEALYVFQLPMSLPLDARVPEERVQTARKALARAKEVGEEYEGVEVATAMVRGRTIGSAIVSEAKRRGVEAIVMSADRPSRVRGGGVLGGRGRVRDRFADEDTRYVVEKAPCRVILTAPPADRDGAS